jgi:hypothetical protein
LVPLLSSLLISLVVAAFPLVALVPAAPFLALPFFFFLLSSEKSLSLNSSSLESFFFVAFVFFTVETPFPAPPVVVLPPFF